jgi:hypothetical protein
MTIFYPNILSTEQLNYLRNLPEVLLAKSSVDMLSFATIYFSVHITVEIRETLFEKWGIDIPVGSQIPMRWIKGDTIAHVDVGSSEFQNTYLMYLNDSPGELIIDSQSYPIQTNTGFVFNEGVRHETLHTEDVPRLLLGPMNEFARPVGRAPISYFNSEADALNEINYQGYSYDYTIGSTPGTSLPYTSWKIASNSVGPASISGVYRNGDVLSTDGGFNYYLLYPSAPCFLEGTTVLCDIDGTEKYIPVEELENGTLVKTSLHGYKPVVSIGKGSIQNPGDDKRTENRLYKCPTANYPQLKQDLYITGNHSILEFPITEKQKEATIKQLGKLFVTDKKYRLMACVDERTEPWNSEGSYTIYHFALEHSDEKMNYGVFVNGGLLVETCSINFLKNKSNMIIR